MSPKKCPFPWNLSPHLIITVSWAKQTLYPEWHLDWLTLVSNRQTDQTTSATIDCILHYTRRTHTRLTALFPGLPRWAGTRKVNPIWILLKQETVSGSGISWAICKSAPSQHPTTVFLQAGCTSCRPTNSIKALKANYTIHDHVAENATPFSPLPRLHRMTTDF